MWYKYAYIPVSLLKKVCTIFSPEMFSCSNNIIVHGGWSLFWFGLVPLYIKKLTHEVSLSERGVLARKGSRDRYLSSLARFFVSLVFAPGVFGKQERGH